MHSKTYACSKEAEEGIGCKPGEEGSADKARDGEDGQGDGKQNRGLGLGDAAILVAVIDEDCKEMGLSRAPRASSNEVLTSGYSDLGTDISKLSDESTDQVVLLPERSVDAAVVALLRLGESLKSLFRDLWHASRDEENVHCSACTCNGEIDVLDVRQIVGIFSVEKRMRGDQRSTEGGDTVPALTEL